MWVNHVILALMGLFAGFAVSAGTFAFFNCHRCYPETDRKVDNGKGGIFLWNDDPVRGVVGNIISTYSDMSMPAGRILLILFGFCAGIFVGCIAVSLAEIINTFPIVFRRYKLSIGLAWALAFMGFGKMAGCIVLFLDRVYEYAVIRRKTEWRKKISRFKMKSIMSM